MSKVPPRLRAPYEFLNATRISYLHYGDTRQTWRILRLTYHTHRYLTVEVHMEYIVKGPHGILHCIFCKLQLQVTGKMEPYCPRCDVTLSGNKAETVLLCENCGHPITVTEKEVFFCNHCKAHPSKDDVLQEEICPRCRTVRTSEHRCKGHHRIDN